MSASTVPVRVAIHQLVDALFDMLDTSSVVVMASNIARPEKPTPMPSVPPSSPTSAVPGPRRSLAAKKPPAILLEHAIEHVRMSCYMNNGKPYVAVNLSPEMCGRLGVAEKSPMIASLVDAKGMFELRPAKGKGKEQGYRLHYIGGTRGLIAMFPGEPFGVCAKHQTTVVTYSHDLDHNRLLITAPRWMPGARPSAPDKPPLSTPPSATTVVTLPSPPLVGPDLDLPCHTCTGKASLECHPCQQVFCPMCWKSHCRTHLGGAA